MAARRRKPASPRPLAGNPTAAEFVRDSISSRLLDLHTAIPAKVKSYDAAKQVADCIPMVRHPAPISDGDVLLEDYPVIPNVPVAWPRGGGYSLQFPLAVGDHVFLIFSECDMARWRTTGELADPGDLRRHDLSYPVAFPCVAPDASPLAQAGASEAVMDGPTTIRLGGPAASYVALAQKVDLALSNLQTWLGTHTHTSGPPGSPTSPPVVPLPPAASVTATKVKAQ